MVIVTLRNSAHNYVTAVLSFNVNKMASSSTTATPRGTKCRRGEDSPSQEIYFLQESALQVNQSISL